MPSRDPDRPNILFILTDDQGPWAMGCAGTPELQTPNLDRLAASGARFENFFCASPVCSPARASILTGQIPSQHGVQDFLEKGNSDQLPRDGRSVQFMKGASSYVQVLAANGYECGLSGMSHLGDSAAPQLGFDFWNVHGAGGGDYNDAPMFTDGSLYYPDGYVTDVITDHAIGFLEDQSASDQPFSLNVHYTAPHSPWEEGQHPQSLFDQYFNNCDFASIPDEPIHPNQVALRQMVGYTPELRREALSGYFASITAMDAQVGRLLDWLEARNLLESTLVVFTSDNGMNMGHHGIWGKGNATYPQNMFDTAVKVPSLASQPGRVPAGQVRGEMLSQYDFRPTILEWLGLQDVTGLNLPGSSFAAELAGAPAQANRPVVVYDEYGPTRMIRTGRLKYVHRYPDGPNEFYDLEDDPNEKANMVDDPSRSIDIAQLRSQLEEWFLRYVDPEIDGAAQPNVGCGQMDRIDSGEEAFLGELVFGTKGP